MPEKEVFPGFTACQAAIEVLYPTRDFCSLSS